MLFKERLTAGKIIFFLVIFALALVGLWFINKNANDNYNRDRAHWEQYQTAIADTRAGNLRDAINTHKEAVKTLSDHTGLRVFFSELDSDIKNGITDLENNSLLGASRNPANALLVQDLVNKIAEESGFRVSGAESNLFGGLTVLTATGAEIVSNDNIPDTLKAQLSATPFDDNNIVHINADGTAFFVHQMPILPIASVTNNDAPVGYIRGVTPVNSLVPPVLSAPTTFAQTDLSEVVFKGADKRYVYDALKGIMAPNTADNIDSALSSVGSFITDINANGSDVLSIAKDVAPGLQLVHSVSADESITALEKRKRWQRLAGLLLLLASLLLLLTIHHLDVSKHFKEKARMQEEIVDSMVDLMERRDSYTANHAKRVATLSSQMAEAAGLNREEQKATKYAATLMNVGKSLIPMDILAKKGKLTIKEKKVVDEALAASAEIVQDIDFDAPVYETMRQLKEQADGKGPLGLSEADILPSARIVSLANAYVAMSSPRPYRKAMPKREIMKRIKEDTGSIFSEDTVKILKEVV